MLGFANLSKSYGQRPLFTDVSLTLSPGRCYGVVGANGSGKSTLLRIISGEETASGGDIAIPKRARLGLLRQDHFLSDTQHIIQVAMMGDREVFDAMHETDLLLAKPETEFDAHRFSELQEIIAKHDGYSLESRAGTILEGLGIPTAVHQNALGTLSGGFKLRVLLGQALAAEPDVLLLDEPTNHLDIISIRWLEKFLATFKGTSLVVSHDHRFLDNACSDILDVDYETILLYPGNYSAFKAAKVEHRDRKEAEIDKQEKNIAHQMAYVERFRSKATKARQAQSKLRMIDRIVVDKLAQSSRRHPKFKFVQRRPSGREVAKVEGVSKSFGTKSVLKNVSLTVQRGERIAIIGPNGIGKSTLLKIMMGELPPDSGTSEWGYEVHPGYFAQDHAFKSATPSQTVQSWLWDACPGDTIGFVRGQLGLVLFSGDEAEKRLTALSGGEAARLTFAKLSVEQPNLLVLDEPTNHLDLEAIESLVEGLKKHDGSMLFVSHDRWFVQELATRIFEIRLDGVHDFKGTYAEYLERAGDDHLDANVVMASLKQTAKQEQAARDQPRAADSGKGGGARSGGPQGKQQAAAATAAPLDPAELRRRKKRAKELETRSEQVSDQLEQVERRKAEIEKQFCAPRFFEDTPREEVTRLDIERAQLNERTTKLEAEWEKLTDAMGQLEA